MTSTSKRSLAIRRTVVVSVLAGICLPCLFTGVKMTSGYSRRKELHSRYQRHCGQSMFSPFAPADCGSCFHTRPMIPDWIGRLVGREWTHPREPLTWAYMVPDSDDDVQKLSPEFELTGVKTVAEDGKCTDRLIWHLMHLPRLKSLDLCNVPITDAAI